MRTRVLAVLIPILLPAAPLAAQGSAAAIAAAPEAGRRSVPAVRASVPPEVDGRLDDAAWRSAPVAAEFVQARPRAGAPASQPTEVRILYDDAAVYVAARMFDAAPDSVVGQLARRDQEVHSDWFSVGLDSYHDRRTAFVFAVNPRGVQRDLLLHDDSQQDPGWDAVWEAAATIDSLGWTAEIRIPLSQLRFRAAAEQVWGLNFSRTIARHDELAHWTPIPPEAAGTVSRYGELRGLDRLRPGRRLELRPYSVARLTRAPGDAGDPFHDPNRLFGSAGLDLRYGVTSDLTLSATINPDFGQVEADPSEVNLSAFESYFEEKRPFFTEGAEIFSAGWPQLLYSRRIGRAPQGALPGEARHADVPEATTILGAVKLTGKTAGGWSVGLLDAVTAEERARFVDAGGRHASAPVEPLTNYAVARVARDFRAGQSALGGIFTATHRRLDGADELQLLRTSAYAGGVDGRHRFGGGNYELSGALLGSRAAGSDSAVARLQRSAGHYFHRPDARHLEYDPSREALGGYSARLGLEKVGGAWRWGLNGYAYSPGFEINDLGYYFGSDRLRQHAMIGYERFRPGRLFRRWTLNLGQMSEWTFGGERQDAALDTYFSYQLLNQWGGYVWYMRHAGGTSTTALRGGPSVVWPARHMGSWSLRSDPRRPLSVRFGAHWEVEDGTGSRSLSLFPTLGLRASGRTSLSLQPTLSWNTSTWEWVGRRSLGDQPQYLLGRLEQRTASLTARLDHTFSPALSLQLYAQPYLSAGDYSDFRRLRDPRAARFAERFHTFDARELWAEATEDGSRVYRVDATGDGAVDFSFRDPDFNFKQLRSNAVLRWEYRPGSTLFLVWSQGRTEQAGTGSLDLGRDLDRLLAAPGTNVLLVKLSYWLGM